VCRFRYETWVIFFHVYLDAFIVSYFTSGDQASQQLAIGDMSFRRFFHTVDEGAQSGQDGCLLDLVSSYAEREIAKVNCHIAKLPSQGVNRVEQANSYRQMGTFDRVAEKRSLEP